MSHTQRSPKASFPLQMPFANFVIRKSIENLPVSTGSDGTGQHLFFGG